MELVVQVDADAAVVEVVVAAWAWAEACALCRVAVASDPVDFVDRAAEMHDFIVPLLPQYNFNSIQTLANTIKLLFSHLK